MRLIYDCLRSPYDIANILQVVLATDGACELHLTGQSLRHDHRKVVGKIGSWSEKIRKSGLPSMSVHYHDSFEKCAEIMHSKGIRLIGTSPQATKSLFDADLSGNDFAVVFGTEVGGLSKPKMALLDDIVQIPMGDQLDFMTLSVITPIVVYEILGQRRRANAP